MKTADLESSSRRDSIKIIGLPESIEGPRTTSFFADLPVEVFGNQILQSPPELDRAHRALVNKSQSDSQPRPVILCLHRDQTKYLIICEACRSRVKLQYRGSPVQIFEVCTPEVAERRWLTCTNWGFDQRFSLQLIYRYFGEWENDEDSMTNDEILVTRSFLVTRGSYYFRGQTTTPVSRLNY